MGSNGGEPMRMSVDEATECSATTVEIKIKTLDSQTFTMRVDKCVPVPELKEQIATVTGVLSEQQRLICRGKVLKDDQLLSAYHVEDGHTLHMVVRQPVAPSETSSDQPGTDPTSSTEQSPSDRVGSGMVVGTFNISDQGDGALPDLNRIVSAVLNSFGLARFGSEVDGLDLNQPPSDRLSAASGLGGLRNSSIMQSDQSASTAVPVEPLQPVVIPDSLTTLLQYLRHLTQEFVAHVREQNASSHNPGTSGSDGQDQEAAARSREARRDLTPEFLAEVMSSTRQLLVGQASVCLSQLAGQLNSQGSMTDPLARSITQSYAMRSGSLFQNIGSLLLELGRAVMTLRMGQSPVDALVNPGPSVFVSPTGPNPIMVQPLPFQPGASFGSPPVGSSQHGSGLTGASVGSGFLPRNIDIRIRTGSVFPRREPTGSQPHGQGAPASSSSINSVQQDGTSSNLHGRESQVLTIPIRTVVAGVPSSVGRGSDSSRGSIGILYPVSASVQRFTSANLNGTRAPQTSDQNGGPDGNSGQPIPDSAAQSQNGNSNSPDDQGLSAQMQSGLEQYTRTVFTGEHVLGDIANPTDSGFAASQTEPARDAVSSQEAASTVTDDGIVLSNILRQIIPIISHSTGAPSTGGEADRSETQDDENSNWGTSSRHRRSPQSQQNPKRQKRD